MRVPQSLRMNNNSWGNFLECRLNVVSMSLQRGIGLNLRHRTQQVHQTQQVLHDQ
ncbi:hypothetical protein FQN60_006424 [Etheostoma spectabile]|uniref:Uncharacterized protein n=1 Tax=Etheostoma spectabile TaxID=54343 RepID=A0A5J5CPK6_9PERO|nr:hypothetical protein FQN60_006424 [Etheostoma spectabile]